MIGLFLSKTKHPEAFHRFSIKKIPCHLNSRDYFLDAKHLFPFGQSWIVGQAKLENLFLFSNNISLKRDDNSLKISKFFSRQNRHPVIEISLISLSAKVLVKKIIFRKNFFIFRFHLCSKEKKVLYGFFIWYQGDFNVWLLKYCMLGLKKVLFGFFIWYQGTFWETKNEKSGKFKKRKNNKK